MRWTDQRNRRCSGQESEGGQAAVLLSVWCGFRGACCCASVVWSREGGSDDGEQCKHDTARAGSDWLGHKAQSGTRFWGGDSIAPSSQPSSPTLLDASHQPALGESWSRLLPADCGLSPSWPHTDAYRWQQQRHRHQTSAAYTNLPHARSTTRCPHRTRLRGAISPNSVRIGSASGGLPLAAIVTRRYQMYLGVISSSTTSALPLVRHVRR